MMRIAAVLILTACFSAGPLRAADQKQEAAQMASASDAHRSCKAAYSACLASCQASGKKDCKQECGDDCEVCALDFGEEPGETCRR